MSTYLSARRMANAQAVSGSLKLIVPASPPTEPVTLATAKAHCRVEASVTDEDALIQSYVTAARTWIEEFMHRAIVSSTFDYAIDAVPSGDAPLLLPRAPLVSVTSVTSYDTSNTATVLSNTTYFVDTTSEPGRIVLNSGVIWPTSLRSENALVVRYVAGYASVPDAIKHALLLLVGHFYQNREQAVKDALSSIPMGVEALLGPYRLVRA